MYRILLADDEWLELDTLEKYIPWEEMGFCIAGTAQNGKEALELLDGLEARSRTDTDIHLPDVLLTDVKMPVMDGLALGQAVHERYPDMQLIYLSGYNDFEYVRSALSVEACDYLLKPLDPDDLRKTMEKVRLKCSQHDKNQRARAAFAAENLKAFLSSLSNREDADWKEICLTCNVSLHLPPENRSFYISLLHIDDYHFLSSNSNDGDSILKTAASEIRRFAEQSGSVPFQINDCCWLLLSGNPTKNILENWLNSENPLTRWMTACTYSGSKDPEHFPALYEEMSRLGSWHARLYGSGHIVLCDTAFPDQSLSAQSGKNAERLRPLIDQIKYMIRQEYKKPLTIETLAEKVYISPNYLRTLFKSYTGETVLEYITRLRLDESVRLLTQTNMRISEIALRIGYENLSHYCAVFKRQTGLTPNQYRAQSAGGTKK